MWNSGYFTYERELAETRNYRWGDLGGRQPSVFAKMREEEDRVMSGFNRIVGMFVLICIIAGSAQHLLRHFAG